MPLNEIEDLLESVISQLKKGSPNAQSKFKDYIKNMDSLDATDVISELRASEEGQEGLAAFIEKRKPNWLND